MKLRRAGARLLYGLLAAAAVYVLVRNLDSPNDYENFLPFGQAALAGQMPYDPAVGWAWLPKEGWATWPPAFAPVAALLARLDAVLGQAATIFLWQLANLAGLAYALAVWIRWLYGRRLSLGPLPGGRAGGSGPGPGHAAGPGGGSTGGVAVGTAGGGLPLWTLPAMVGLLVPARLLLSNFEHTQSNLLILALAVAGFELFRRGRRWGGGAALGLSTAFKATSLVVLPYLAWRGRWRDLGAAAAGCVATWVLLPAALVGPGRLGRWYTGWLEHTAALHLPTGPMNQSLQATLTRLFAPGGVAVPEGPGAGGLGGYGAAPWFLAATVLLALAAAVAFGRPLRRVSRRREALELGVAFTAMGLLSPIGWKWHYVGLLPLALALYAVLPRAAGWISASAGPEPATSPSARPDSAISPSADAEAAGRDLGVLRGRSAAVVAAALLAAGAAVNLTATDLIGGARADLLERWGVVTWSALLLVVAALWALWRGRRVDGGADGVAGEGRGGIRGPGSRAAAARRQPAGPSPSSGPTASS